MHPIAAVMNEARHEIIRLRRANELLQAKVDVMDLFACVLHTTPAYQGQGMSIDIAWQLQQEIERLEKQEPVSPEGPAQ